MKNANPHSGSREWSTILAQGMVLAFWQAEGSEVPKGFKERVRLLRGQDADDEGGRLWRGPVNVLSWRQLGKIVGKDYRFEFRHCGKNVCVTSADLSGLRPGDLIWIGKTLMAAIQCGFECPRRCHLDPEDPEPCALARNWVFAEVLEGGAIAIDDPILATRA